MSRVKVGVDVKKLSLLNGHECWAKVKIWNPSAVMVTSSYDWTHSRVGRQTNKQTNKQTFIGCSWLNFWYLFIIMNVILSRLYYTSSLYLLLHFNYCNLFSNLKIYIFLISLDYQWLICLVLLSLNCKVIQNVDTCNIKMFAVFWENTKTCM